ncbi:MAG: mechanosensitive ion channel, partial [Moraxellaceae bacterium]
MDEITSVTTLISQKLIRWTEAFIKMLPNIVLAAVIVTLGFYVARFVKRLLKKVIARFLHNPALVNLFTTIIYIFLLSIVLFSALSVLQLDKAVTSLLAGAGIIGLALAFAFQDIASNFMSGIFIIVRKPLKVGDSVILDKFSGTVTEINLRDTVIRTAQGVLVTIPNKEVFQKPIQNVNELERRRYDLRIGVSYAEDLAKVKTVALEAIK